MTSPMTGERIKYLYPSLSQHPTALRVAIVHRVKADLETALRAATVSAETAHRVKEALTALGV